MCVCVWLCMCPFCCRSASGNSYLVNFGSTFVNVYDCIIVSLLLFPCTVYFCTCTVCYLAQTFCIVRGIHTSRGSVHPSFRRFVHHVFSKKCLFLVAYDIGFNGETSRDPFCKHTHIHARTHLHTPMHRDEINKIVESQ